MLRREALAPKSIIVILLSQASPDQAEAKRGSLAWLWFAAFEITAMGLGSVFAFRIVPVYLGIDLDHQLVGWSVLWLVAVASLVMALLVLFVAFAWLLFARFVFTGEAVSKVVFYGPAQRIERWLFNALFPPVD